MGDFCAFAFIAGRQTTSGALLEGQKWLQIVLGGLSPSKKVHKDGIFWVQYAKEHEFPQVFAQVWKTLGRDQIPYALPAALSVVIGKRECSIRRRSLTGWCEAH